MSLVTKIQTIVTSLTPDATFILSSRFKASVSSFSLETAQYPLIILDNELSKDVEIKKNANLIKDTRIVISVLEPNFLGATDAETDTIYQECELIADKIAVNLYRELEIRPNGNQKYRITPAFHVYATNLSGAILEIKANENVVINWNPE